MREEGRWMGNEEIKKWRRERWGMEKGGIQVFISDELCSRVPGNMCYGTANAWPLYYLSEREEKIDGEREGKQD